MSILKIDPRSNYHLTATRNAQVLKELKNELKGVRIEFMCVKMMQDNTSKHKFAQINRLESRLNLLFNAIEEADMAVSEAELTMRIAFN